MRPRSWLLLPWLGILACSGCGRSSRSNEFRTALLREIESRVVPAGTADVSVVILETRSCVIGTQWTFATSWDLATYANWLRTRLAQDFTEVSDSGKLAFSRHQQGDSHSLIIEASPLGGAYQIRATLCAYPD